MGKVSGVLDDHILVYKLLLHDPNNNKPHLLLQHEQRVVVLRLNRSNEILVNPEQNLRDLNINFIFIKERNY